MNENLNLVELLKDCPKGTKFYSTIYGDVYFDCIDLLSPYPVTFKTFEGEMTTVTKSGLNHLRYNGECTFFPSREQRDWSKWHLPFKDGDIIFTRTKGNIHWVSIFKRNIDEKCETYVDLNVKENNFFDDTINLCSISEIIEQRFATEYEQKRLFEAIKEHGYRWSTDTKTLEDISDSKFKECLFNVSFRFNPNTLNPFDKVLGRCSKSDTWKALYFSHISENDNYPYCCGTVLFRYCIPYDDDTAYLIGTDKEAPKYYRYWEE